MRYLLLVLAATMTFYAAFVFAIGVHSLRRDDQSRAQLAVWMFHGLLLLVTGAFAFAAYWWSNPWFITAVAVAAVADYMVQRVLARSKTPSDTDAERAADHTH